MLESCLLLQCPQHLFSASRCVVTQTHALVQTGGEFGMYVIHNTL